MVTVEKLPDLVAVKAKYDALKARAVAAAHSINDSIPLDGKLDLAQRAFLLALSDLKKIEMLSEYTDSYFAQIEVEETTPEKLVNSGDVDTALADAARVMVDAIAEQYGLCEKSVMPAIMLDLDSQVDMLEKLVVRVEANVTLVVGTGA